MKGIDNIGLSRAWQGCALAASERDFQERIVVLPPWPLRVQLALQNAFVEWQKLNERSRRFSSGEQGRTYY